MAIVNSREAYEFDPETYGSGGGLPGMLRQFLLPHGPQQVGNTGLLPNGAPEYNSGSNDSPHAGLLDRLLSLQAEQSRYQPIPQSAGQPPFAAQTPQTRITVRPFDTYSPYNPEGPSGQEPPLPRDPNVRQLARLASVTPLPISGAAAPQAKPSTPRMQAGYEADQAQQAREAAAARLARGVRNFTRLETQRDLFNSDPVDVAKSMGIGLVNGAVSTAGLPGDLLTGFGYFPSNFVPNLFRRMSLLPATPIDQADVFKSWTSRELRRWLEGRYGEFYTPKSRAGRYAETIGEFAPLILGGPAAAGAFRGAQAAAAAVRELPGTLAKHAVAPGVAVQALEEALPDSKLGQTVQKAYPALRRVVPAALAAKRYLRGRVVPQ